MPAPTTPTSQTPSAAEPADDLGSQARRWRRRTTDLLAIGLLVIVGLAVGRQLTAWWNDPVLADSPPQVVASVTGPGTAWNEPSDLGLGTLPTSVRRRVVAGDRQAVWIALEAATLEAAKAAGWPVEPIAESEANLLARLRPRQPQQPQQPQQPDLAERRPGTSLHRIDGPLPMVVAVRQLLGDRRVVSWSLATRTPDARWVTWTFAGHGSASPSPLALPAGSQRLLALGGDDRELLIIFTGSPADDAWWRHFQAQLADTGWQPAAPRFEHTAGWTARWSHLASGGTAVVSARRDTSGTWHGMLNIFTPQKSPPAHGETTGAEDGAGT